MTDTPDTSRLGAILASLPPEMREKTAAAIAEIGAVMAAYHPDKLRADGPPAVPIAKASREPTTAPVADYGNAWKVPALVNIATEALRISAALDRVILPLIRKQTKSQRQIQREIEALREEWQGNFGKRQSCLNVLTDVVEATDAADMKRRSAEARAKR